MSDAEMPIEEKPAELRRTRRRHKNDEETFAGEIHGYGKDHLTPSTITRAENAQNEDYKQLQTPRRSSRKSVKTVQDYEEIVSKRALRSTAKKMADVVEVEVEGEISVPVPRWTPAKVGRVSEKRKRRGRKASTVMNLNELFRGDGNENENVPTESDDPKIMATSNTEVINLTIDETVEIKHSIAKKESQLLETCVVNTVGIRLKGDECTNEQAKPDEDEANVVENDDKKSENNNTFEIVSKKGDKLDSTFEIPHDGDRMANDDRGDHGQDEHDDDMGLHPLSETELTDMPSLIFIDDNDDDVTDVANTKVAVEGSQKTPQSPQKERKRQVNVTTSIGKGQQSKILRAATPYRVKNVKKRESGENDEADKLAEASNLRAMANVSHRPRRRSRSTGALKVNILKKDPPTVTFCSPENRTILIEDFDNNKIADKKKLRVDSVAKVHAAGSQATLAKIEATTVKTLKTGFTQTPSKLRQTPQKPVSRTKLPNFAAIHQRQFEKMENLVDHVARKVERARNLTNSSSKLGMAATSGRKLAKWQMNKATNKENTPPPVKSKVSKNIASVFGPLNSEDLEKLKRLPAPQFGQKINIINATPVVKSKSKVAPRNQKLVAEKQQQQQKQKQPAQIKTKSGPRPKAKFDAGGPLSSVAVVKNVATWQSSVPANVSSKLFEFGANGSCPPVLKSSDSPKDKIAARRQRHIDMFKGRSAANAPVSSTSRSEQFIRGVRLNRRFDLQMQHRQNMGN